MVATKIKCVRAAPLNYQDLAAGPFTIDIGPGWRQVDRTRTWMSHHMVFCQMMQREDGVYFEVPQEMWDFELDQFVNLKQC